MDVESDGSERWEDFFGSSTDIGPSVLGYLDTLANNFSEEAKQLVESSNNKLQLSSALPTLPQSGADSIHVIKHDQTSARSQQQQQQQTVDSSPFRCDLFPASPPPPSSPPSNTELNAGRVKKFSDKFFNLVSPNVQRMVSNTTAEDRNVIATRSCNNNIGEETSPSFLRNHVHSASFSASSPRKPVRQMRAKVSSPPLQATGGLGHKHLPLSKNIAKLTHDSEIMDHFIENITSTTNRQQSQVDANGNIANEKPPARHSPIEELQNVSTLQLKIRSLTVDLENGTELENGSVAIATATGCADTEENSSSDVVLRNEQNNSITNIDNAFVENCVDLSDHRNTVIEACNFYPNLGKTVPTNPDDRRTLAEARAKHGLVPNSPQLSTRISNDKNSTSTPSLDTTISGSPYSSKASLLTPTPNTPVLSSRPLSASSIGSYSSSASSSSSSEHHLLPGGKGSSAPGSYQASVESLADHSETERHGDGSGVELLVPGGGGIPFSITGMTMCERAVREIIDSESSYVKDLGQVIRGYLEDWKERACLRHDQLKVLFSNIQEVYDFNFKLLNRLREAKGDPVTISNCFIDLHAEFSCYTTYCTSYPEAISLLTTLLQATHTNSLLVSTQKMLKHTLPLGSYLLKPVQRILKYHLLLDNLRKHCNDQQVALAHELMKKVAHNIDQVKTKLDQARLVKELAGILDGWLGPDLSVLGDLLHEGRLLEHSKPRIVLLFQTMLIIAKPKEDKRLQFRAYIPCKNLMLVEHLPGEPVCFRVIPFDDPKGALQLTARNRDEKRLWTQQIKKAMLQHYDIPKRAKELVLQLGDEDERFMDKQYWKRPTNNSPIPEYLERRQQFRRSEMRMRSKKNLLKKDTPPVNGLSGPSFRSYSCELECTPTGAGSAVSSTDDCKCDAVKRQLQEEINNSSRVANGGTEKDSPPPKPVRSRSETRCGPADDEEERLLKSLYERRKLSVPTKRSGGTKMKESFASIRSYNSTMIPKRISEIRKRRPKTLTSSSTFYTDLEVSSEANLTDHETKEVVEDQLPTSAVTASTAVEEKGNQKTAPVTGTLPSAHKKDSEIISQLILDVGQFNKVLNKPVAKKKSFDASNCKRPTALLNSDRKPEPPNTEPPCDDEENKDDPCPGSGGNSNDKQHNVPGSGSDEAEPIYESLLRNVHVPYKYAPPSLARNSLPCGENNGTTCRNGSSSSCPKLPQDLLLLGRRTRPESDYVTLAYSELGLLEGIAAEDARSLQIKSGNNGQHKTPQLLRNSDTNISYHRDKEDPEKISTTRQEQLSQQEQEREEREPATTPKGQGEPFNVMKQAFLERQGSLSMKSTTQKSILQRFISLHSSPSSGGGAGGTLGSEGNLLHSLQRKLSEPNGGGSGPIYKQGSMDLGSRIAHLDYADPKTLFFPPSASTSMLASMGGSSTTLSNQNVLINRASMLQSSVAVSKHLDSKQQRDSVLASSSSSDSVCDEQHHQQPLGGGSTGGYDDDDDERCCFYERTVEECLEHDFRDSAVYSGDDNNDRQHQQQQQLCEENDDGASEQQHLYEALTPKRHEGTANGDTNAGDGYQLQQQRISGAPPPVPAKPAHLGRSLKRYPVSVQSISKSATAAATSTTSTTGSSSNNNTRGWVLQQVRRFQ